MEAAAGDEKRKSREMDAAAADEKGMIKVFPEKGFYLIYHKEIKSDVVATSMPLTPYKLGNSRMPIKRPDPSLLENLNTISEKNRKELLKRPPVDQDIKAIIRRADVWRAESAVELHNEMAISGDGCELELVDALRSNPFMFNGMWYHVNFTAKPKGSPDDQVKLYFAELRHRGHKKDTLTKLCPVEPKGSSNAEDFGGCLGCRIGHKICHPSDGGFTGVPQRRVETPGRASSTNPRTVEA